MSSLPAAEQARAYVDSARAVREVLRELHEHRGVPQLEHRRKVAEANADMGFALKAAEVYATLAAADALTVIARRLEPVLDLSVADVKAAGL